MDAVVEHFQNWWVLYALLAIVLAPTAYFTRRYSAPIIQWMLELCLYAVIMHTVVHYFIIVVKWFKLNTTMYFNERTDPGWGTPLVEFWARSEYSPSWLFWAELVALVLMLAAMIRMRPMKIQQKGFQRASIQKGGMPQYPHPGQPGARSSRTSRPPVGSRR